MPARSGEEGAGDRSWNLGQLTAASLTGEASTVAQCTT